MAAASVSVALGPAREEVLPALPVLLSRRSLRVCVCVYVCVSVWTFVVVGFFFNKEKKMCIFLAMTET